MRKIGHKSKVSNVEINLQKKKKKKVQNVDHEVHLEETGIMEEGEEQPAGSRSDAFQQTSTAPQPGVLK